MLIANKKEIISFHVFKVQYHILTIFRLNFFVFSNIRIFDKMCETCDAFFYKVFCFYEQVARKKSEFNPRRCSLKSLVRNYVPFPLPKEMKEFLVMTIGFLHPLVKDLILSLL